MNELSPILTKHRIFIYPEVINAQRSERQTSKGGTLLYSILTIKYHFAHEDGSEICVTVIGEGMDSGDKASNKAMAVAFKYACLQMFCIPTDDMEDPDKETPPSSTARSEAKQTAPLNNDKQEIDNLGKEIGEILNANNPDGKPYFSENEINLERSNFNKAKDLEAVKMQHMRLKKYLEIRTEKYMSSVPSGDGHPSFQDDIPFLEVNNGK
jgi:hypothetical protein